MPKPISKLSSPRARVRSMEPPSVSLRPVQPVRIGASATPSRLSKPSRLPRQSLRTLDFDIETVAAGFADPQWVPNRTVVWACAWVDGGDVRVDALPVAKFYDKRARRRFLEPLLHAIGEADVLTGHNVLRFDLPVLNAECLLLGLPTLRPVLVQDTIRLPKSKGFKKGQDNMSHGLDVRAEKMPLSWAQWEEAYGEKGLGTVKERCASDVRMHMEMRAAMLDRGVLGAPRMWRP